jgi:hypothetical protein
MSKQTIKSMDQEMSFNVNDYNLITDPGTFEGSPLYVPYFWQMVMHGCAEEHMDGDSQINELEITKEDANLFPELQEDLGMSIYLYTDDNGFVYHHIDAKSIYNY